ncbi:MAG TPA: hypothetical protein VFY12_10650, partial [Arenimonas sp.]|nr:hypothetical protein [Arenimonas sp.]
DVEGALRLVALAEWLSRQTEPHAAMAARPEDYRAFEHAIALEGDQLVLTRLGRYGTDQQQWRIPLPGSAVVEQH